MVAFNLTPETDPQREKLVKDTAASLYGGGYLVCAKRILINDLG